MGVPVFRFAPSPNGRLHLGHAYSALLNATLAARMGGRFLVRLEDIDPTRCTPALADACLRDLAWLGLRWEEPVRMQSQHFDEYGRALDDLRERNLLYPCFCTRRQIAESSHATDPDGAPLYSGTCAHLSPSEIRHRMAGGDIPSWRLRMSQARKMITGPLTYTRFTARGEESVSADPARWGDAVLARKETPTSYHLSVVVDDARQAVTHVVRGADLEASTDLHILLQALLDVPSPVYHHHALIQADTGDKLSKSRGSESLADLRERGVTPEEIREMLEVTLR